MSTLALLVVLLLVFVGLLVLGAVVYLTYRYPQFARPLSAAGAWGAVLVAAVVLVLAAR
ncbi:hypothetical protein ACIGW7_20605 [Streptomyces sp. NPDC053253]|uniref:hypothetical protein n=1 Tax=Streptomyces sp. NPDC053253 TaxID=3365699 RepID=UPI0037D0E1F8